LEFEVCAGGEEDAVVGEADGVVAESWSDASLGDDEREAVSGVVEEEARDEPRIVGERGDGDVDDRVAEGLELPGERWGDADSVVAV
jgi:hypothetical protein